MSIPQQDYVEVEVDPIPGVSRQVAQDILSDAGLSMDLSNLFNQMAKRIQAGEEISWDQVQEEVQQLALEKYGTEYGVALPPMNDIDRPLILAKGSPLYWHAEANNASAFMVDVLRRGYLPRNRWHRLGDEEVVIADVILSLEEAYPDEDWGDMSDHLFKVWNLPRKQVALIEWPSTGRARKLMDELRLRTGSHQTAEAEFRAMDSLKTRLKPNQWRTYVLNGVFAERSTRSGVYYFFRKGRPTLAVRADDKGSRILACLCLHPHGYYAGSHVGLMTPTDEVIAHLLMMRADEHKFWAKSGQWPAHDPRSGL